MTLTISPSEHGGFAVRIQDDIETWNDGLTQDEALWVTAQFLMKKKHRYLKTAAEHAAWEQQRKENRESNERTNDDR